MPDYSDIRLAADQMRAAILKKSPKERAVIAADYYANVFPQEMQRLSEVGSQLRTALVEEFAKVT